MGFISGVCKGRLVIENVNYLSFLQHGVSLSFSACSAVTKRGVVCLFPLVSAVSGTFSEVTSLTTGTVCSSEDTLDWAMVSNLCFLIHLNDEQFRKYSVTLLYRF